MILSIKNAAFLVFLLLETAVLFNLMPSNLGILAVRAILAGACLGLIAFTRWDRTPAFSAANDPGPGSADAFEGKDLAGLYHEIRNCTCTLKGNALLLKQGLKTEAERAPVERIERIAASIERIAREVMVLADPEMAEPAGDVCIGALIRECMADYFPGSPDTFSFENCSGSPLMGGEPTKLRQVFVNLFKNSLEADASRIRVRIKREAGWAHIEVEDDGRGCAPGDLERIFLPLHTTKKEKGGMGMGLAVAKSIVEAHGGTLWAESSPRSARESGRTVMHLNLPLAAGAPPARPRSAVPAGA